MKSPVAVLRVPLGVTLFPCEEVPGLTASALFGAPDKEPDPQVPASELRRLNSEHERGAGAPLTQNERVQVERICRLAGLDEFDKPPTYTEWGQYLETFNSQARERGWWAALMPIRDPHRVSRFNSFVVEQEHRAELVEAIESGKVTARLRSMRAAPRDMHISHLSLTLDELEKFCALLCIGVEVAEVAQYAEASPKAERDESGKRPCFSIPARPLCVDAGLSALEPHAQVEVCTSLAGATGLSVCSAQNAVETIQGIINRQAEGHYTMQEVAEIIAAAQDLDARDFLKTRMTPGFVSGGLLLLDPKDGGPVEGRQCNDFHDWLTPANADKWLERAGFQFRWPTLAESVPAIAEPVTAVMESDSAPLPTGEIADAFDGIGGRTSTQWRNALGDPRNHQWVLPARAVQGTAPTPSTWCPLKFACLLRDRGETVESLNRVFLEAPKLKPWRHDWQEAMRERNAFGQ